MRGKQREGDTERQRPRHRERERVTGEIERDIWGVRVCLCVSMFCELFFSGGINNY